MVYRKKTYTYRKGTKGYGSRKLTPLQKKEVKQLIGIREELKAVDTSVLLSPTAAGTLTKLAHPAQGVGVSDRVGDSIRLKRIRGHITVVGADSTNVVRLILFRWYKNDSVGAPTIPDILQTLSTMSMYQFTSQRQNEFHVIYDKYVTTSNTGPNVKLCLTASYGTKLGRKNIEFEAALTTGEDCVYFLAISDSVAGPHPGVAGVFRMEYSDS